MVDIMVRLEEFTVGKLYEFKGWSEHNPNPFSCHNPATDLSEDLYAGTLFLVVERAERVVKILTSDGRVVALYPKLYEEYFQPCQNPV